MRAVSLHSDVLAVTSAVLQAKCVVVRAEAEDAEAGGPSGPRGEAFVIDSPVLPEELDALAALVAQARFPEPNGLLATHGDWDHMLGRLAFPELSIGCAESTAERLTAEPGGAQRELRRFDEELMIERRSPLALGTVQALAVPGRCEIGARELELYPSEGHTVDGMAVWIAWAGTLVAGDYLSPVEIPSLEHGGGVEPYLATLGRLRPLVEKAEHVLPGHGPVIDGRAAARVLDEDLAYLEQLRERGSDAELPPGRRTRQQRAIHAENARLLG